DGIQCTEIFNASSCSSSNVYVGGEEQNISRFSSIPASKPLKLIFKKLPSGKFKIVHGDSKHRPFIMKDLSATKKPPLVVVTSQKHERADAEQNRSFSKVSRSLVGTHAVIGDK